MGRWGPTAFVLAGLALIDHHCHGVVPDVADRDAFELLVNEGFDPPPAGTTHIDAPAGLSVLRWCPPILGLAAMASAKDYLARRAELGGDEVNRRLLGACGLEAMYVDTGYRSAELLDVAAMGEAAGAVARPVVRVEAVMESLAAREVEAAVFPAALQEALWKATEDAVGLKSIVAYRGGFELDPERPSHDEAVEAAGGWFRQLPSAPYSAPRVVDPVLLRLGLWTAAAVAAERGMPIQLHSGFGDPDLTIHLANPSVATWFVRATAGLGVNVVFLHCYPYHREAAYLAAVMPNAYFDLGASLNYVGPGAPSLMAEALELAPFSKHLFSTDAFGLPELYLAGTMQFRSSLAAVLDGWVAEERCTADAAERIARMIGRENALRIYPP